MCGNENISGIPPFLIEKLWELIRSMLAKRKTNSEHQLMPFFLSLQKRKENRDFFFFLKFLDSLWTLLIPVVRFNKGQLFIITFTGRRGHRKSGVLSFKKAMFCYIPGCGWIVQPASKWCDYFTKTCLQPIR